MATTELVRCTQGLHGCPDPRRVQIRNLWSAKVGGPGFEPGASRSRNLGSLVHRDRFRGFEFISMTQLPVSSRFRPPDLPRVLRELLHDLPVYRSLKPVST